MDNKIEAAIDVLEARNWRVDLKDDYTFLEWYSPAGEDFCIESESNDLLKIFEDEWDSWDVDDHVALWAGSRGKNGVPASYAALLEDAYAIGNELEECVKEVRNALQP